MTWAAVTLFDPADGRPMFSHDLDEWRRRWPCGCAFWTGWWADTHEAGALFVACADPGPHAEAMQRAHRRYTDMVDRPTNHRDLAETKAVEIIAAIVDEERR